MEKAIAADGGRSHIIVVGTALAMELGWLLRQPAVAFPAAFAALCLQAWALLTSQCLETAVNAASLLLWLIGHSVWMSGELIWGVPAPAGILAEIAPRVRLDKLVVLQHTKTMSCIVLFGTFGVLASFHLTRCPGLSFSSRHRHRAAGAGGSGECCPKRRNLVGGIALRTYSNLWLLPWLLMGACWGACGLRRTWDMEPGILGHLSVFGSLASIALCGDCIHRYSMKRQVAEVVHHTTHLLWVLGSLVWMIDDLFIAESAQGVVHRIAVAVLGAGFLFAAYGVHASCSASDHCASAATRERRPLLVGGKP